MKGQKYGVDAVYDGQDGFDYAMSGQENIVHASDSPENAAIELKRFFRDGEIFDYLPCALRLLYAPDEL